MRSQPRSTVVPQSNEAVFKALLEQGRATSRMIETRIEIQTNR